MRWLFRVAAAVAILFVVTAIGSLVALSIIGDGSQLARAGWWGALALVFPAVIAIGAAHEAGWLPRWRDREMWFWRWR